MRSPSMIYAVGTPTDEHRQRLRERFLARESGALSDEALLELLRCYAIPHPRGQVADSDLEEVLQLACELRQRVREQLHLISPGECEKISLGVRMTGTGKVIVPALPDANRIQRVTLPSKPIVGGIHAKLRAAYEAGVKQVLIPVDNVKDTADLPQYVKDALTLVPVNSLDQVIARSLLDAPTVNQTVADERTEVLGEADLRRTEDRARG